MLLRLALFFVCSPFIGSTQLIEEDRLEEYAKRGYSWPIEKFVPDTAGWDKLMRERLDQILEIENQGDRYMGLYKMMHSSLLAPNYTEFGFGLARAPEALTQELREGIHDGLRRGAIEPEKDVPVILGATPLFIKRPDLLDRVLEEMQVYAEAWAGIPLVAFQAYGFRLYQNGSQLMMHTDRMKSHIISFILHIGSSEDSDPWPIYIEDFFGNTHEVILTPGDVLFYESSKCTHGRPKPFNGSWYTSVFVHYHPIGWDEVSREHEAHYRVPPMWSAAPPKQRKHTELTMSGMSYREPGCPNDWCRTQNTIKWTGPGEDGYVINPNMQKSPLNIHELLGDSGDGEEL